MKKLTYALTYLTIVILFIAVGNVRAQISQDFQGYSIGDSLTGIGWSASDVQAKIADDPISSGNNVLQNTIHNYNAAPVLRFVLPAGKTLADYSSFTFKGYFTQGDVGYKDIMVEAYQAMPTGQFGNTAAAEIGSWSRAQAGSTVWEDITVDITNTSSLSDTIYVAFGISCAGTGDVGGTGVTTIWYADDVALVAKPVDNTLVDQWGKTSQGTAWPLIQNATAGTVGLGNGAIPTGWATIGGHFDTLTATTTQAVVVTGKMELVGGGGASAYTWLRYALTYQDSTTLNNAGTDSATWASPQKWYGYEFDPRSGAATMANGGGGQGTVWGVNNGNWASTYSNGGPSLAAVKNQPYNAEAIAGTYNFAISVQSVNDTVNEIHWYLIEQNNKYWFGGTVQGVSTTKKFNAINFGFNNDFEGTQVNFTDVKAELGTPITVPEAPWQSYYVDQWGKTSSGTAWPVIWDDSTTIVGNAGLGNGAVPTGWATIRGGFGDPVTISTSKAIIVTGKMELVGGGGASAYTWLRYALTFQDSTKLNYRGTDSAKWVNNVDTLPVLKSYGYEFDPRSGAGTMANGGGGQGTVWAINNGNWASTYSNGGPSLAAVKNQPYNAEAIAGTYNFAISVQSVNDTVNEIRWYLIEQNNKYWFGGTVQGVSTTKKFNGINFGFNNDFEGTQVNFTDVNVDLGTPITVPEAPWQSYYVDQWGKTSLGTAWPVIWNDSTTIVGDAGLGNGATPTGWATIRGGFGDPVTISTSKAIVVTGKMELVGGGGASAYTWLRYALTFQDSTKLNYRGTDSAMWVNNVDTLPVLKSYGYEFDPRSGAATMANGGGGQGTVWAINNGNWSSTYSNGGPSLAAVKNQPYNAEAIAGTYDFAISVQSVNDTVNEIRWYLIEQNNKYWFGGTVQGVSTTKKFNSINFGFNNDFEGTQVNFTDVKVDLGAPITVPVAPFQAFYVDQWGFFGNKIGGWAISNNDIVGNVTASGSATNTDWVALRGAFESFTPTSSRPLKITGELELVGGGFDVSSSLRVGIFNTDSAGTLVIDTAAATLPDSTRWTGTDGHSTGYLFIPQSGSNGAVTWGSGSGTWGAVMDTTWLSPNGYVLGSEAADPTTGGAGKYNFTISVTPQGDGTSLVKFNLFNSNYAWVLSKIDNHSPLVTDKFNSIGFALNTGNSVTAMNLTNVQIDTGTVTAVNEPGDGLVPAQFELSQNYPNPFNPSTTINFALPKASEVHLVVYDLLGRVVTTLVNGNLNAGYHKINFNAANLASGVYFYSIKAGDFTSVKKLMLLK